MESGGFSNVRHLSICFALAATLLIAGACSRAPLVGKYFAAEEKAGGPEPIGVELRLHQSELAPGDPLIADAVIRNWLPTPQEVQPLHVESIEFYAVGAGDSGPVRLRPVFSRKERPEPAMTLAPDQVASRTFVFTQATKAPGSYRIEAIYHPVPRGVTSDLLPGFSKPLSYQVSGPVSLRRDVDGIILKEDAIALAQAHLNRPVSQAAAILAENGAGFLDWWVTLTIDAQALNAVEPPQRAFFVNPYLGVVVTNRQAVPFADRPAQSIKPGKASRSSRTPDATGEPPQVVELVQPTSPTIAAPPPVPAPAPAPQPATTATLKTESAPSTKPLPQTNAPHQAKPTVRAKQTPQSKRTPQPKSATAPAESAEQPTQPAEAESTARTETTSPTLTAESAEPTSPTATTRSAAPGPKPTPQKKAAVPKRATPTPTPTPTP